MITSPHNEKLKQVRKLLAKRRRDQFVAEGEDLLAAADEAGWQPRERLVAAGSGLQGEEVDPELLASVSTLGSGTRAIGIYDTRWQDAPSDGTPCVALFGVRDPGNVGTILRSALAFGAAQVAFGPDCADPYGPKAVRASMGAVFQVPTVRVEDPARLPGEKVALEARGEEILRGPMPGVTLMIGAEREGLPPAALAAADRHARIPIRNESLNAAMAATVALYEVTRPCP